MKKKLSIFLIVFFAILSGLWYALFYKGDVSEPVPSEPPVTCVPSPSPTVTVKNYILVHICGSVNSPGVVAVEKGTRLIDAIETAGGFDEYADRDWLNLAVLVKDGERIYVPSKEETESLTLKQRMEGSGVAESSGSVSKEEGKPVNINTAGVDELVTLPGIGESRAKDIIAYRTRVGEFKTTEEIKNVSGIGDSLFSRIAGRIYVE